MLMSVAKQLFRGSAPLLKLIDEIIPIASKHTYTFVSDDWYKGWTQSMRILLAGCFAVALGGIASAQQHFDMRKA